MAGLYLYQVQQALLASLGPVNDALRAAGVPLLSAIVERSPSGPARRGKPPWLEVTLAGSRDRDDDAEAVGDVGQAVPVTATLFVDGPESLALRTEGVVTATLAGLRATLQAACVDADLLDWQYAGGSAGYDEERTNGAAWLVELAFVATFGW